MRVLGIDPGYATVGYGAVDYEGNKFVWSEHGAIITPAKTPFEARLEQLFDENRLDIGFLSFEPGHRLLQTRYGGVRGAVF